MPTSKLTGRQFAARRRYLRDVHENTAEGRVRWARNEDHASAEVWLAVLVEEVGKLARTLNKLHIAEDADVIEQWETEGWHRLVTCGSVLERMAAVWPIRPAAALTATEQGGPDD